MLFWLARPGKMRCGTGIMAALALLVLALALGGCGSSSDESGSSKSGSKGDGKQQGPVKLSGAYSGTVTTDASSFPDSTPGATLPVTYLYTCEDEDCDTVWQRALDHSTGAGTTVRLTRTGANAWEADGLQKRTCPEDAKRVANVRSKRTWELDGDKLAGSREEKVAGCTTPYFEDLSFEGEVDSKAEVPYLDAADTAPMKQAITAFDSGYAGFVKQEPKCVKQVSTEGQVDKGIACYRAAFKPWIVGIKGVPAALQGITAGAEGDCAAALAAATPLVKKEMSNVAGVAKMYDNKPASRWAAVSAAEGKNFEHAHKTHVAVADVAYFCVAPTDVQGLGVNGKLRQLDEALSLAPLG